MATRNVLPAETSQQWKKVPLQEYEHNATHMAVSYTVVIFNDRLKMLEDYLEINNAQGIISILTATLVER